MRLILPALAVCAFALSLLAPSAGAAVPRTFFGVNASTSGETVSEADAKLLKSGRVGLVRTSFDWAAVQPEKDGPYNWQAYDTLVRRTSGAGARILATLQSSPAWVATKPSYPPDTDLRRREFAQFTSAAVKRYGTKGTFWRENPDVPKRPITLWQVWNEPNLGFWWYENPNAEQYYDLLRPVSNAIRKADKGAKVVLAGLPETNGIPMATYLEQLYKLSPKFKTYFDVLAIHPFGRGWAGVEGALYRLRQVTKKHKDNGTKVLISEIGWATGGGKDADFQVTTPKGQSDRLRSTFRNLVKYRERWGVQGVLWYAWEDLPPYDWWILNCGLFDRNGKAKPSWKVFTSFTRNSGR